MHHFCLVYRLWIFISLILVGCCPKDPTCKGETSLCPSQFWQPKDDIRLCPCEFPWNLDLEDRMASLQKSDVQVAHLIDIALMMNPTTQQAWADARAAAYYVEMTRSALYPNVVLDEQLTYSYTGFDDGPPLLDIAPLCDPTAIGMEQNPACLGPQSNLNPDVLLSGIKPNALIRNKNSFGRNINDMNSLMKRSINQVTRQRALNRRNAAVNNINLTAIDPGIVVGDEAESIGPSRILAHNLSISYLLLDFGGRQATIEAAKQALYYSNWTHNRQIQRVIISVLQAYYIYAGISYLLEARQSDLENARKNYEAASAQFEAGIRNKLDVLQAKTDVINIELSIVDLEGQQKIAHGNLAANMGLPAHTSFNTPEVPKHLPIDVMTSQVDELIELAKNRRPDLAAAYAIHAQRKAEMIIARSEGLPTLGSLINLQELNDMINPSFNTHSISGSLMLSVPLFSGFLYVNQERRAREFVRAACANIRNVEINVTLDVITSYFNFKTAAETLRYTEEYLKYSQEAYDAAFITYREGIGTILDLLSAQRVFANAKAETIQARTRWAIALSNISFALGTLGTEDEIKPWR